MEKVPTFTEFIGLDKFLLTKKQLQVCIDIANQSTPQSAIEEARKYELENCQKN